VAGWHVAGVRGVAEFTAHDVSQCDPTVIIRLMKRQPPACFMAWRRNPGS